MKAKTKKAAVAAKTAQPAKAVVAKPAIKHNQVDVHVGYNSEGRFKRTEYEKAVAGAMIAMPKFGQQRYLLTKGEKGLLINQVDYDPSGFYRRRDGDKDIYGSVNQLNELDKGFSAEVLTAQELVARALKKVKVMRFKNRASGEELDVALLNPSTDPYFVGVSLTDKNHLRVENMEPAAKYNAKSVQWVQLRDVSDAKLVTKLTNFGAAKTTKALAAS